MSARRLLPCPRDEPALVQALRPDYEVLAAVPASDLVAAVQREGADVVLARLDEDEAVRRALDELLARLPGVATVVRVAEPSVDGLIASFRRGVGSYVAVGAEAPKLRLALAQALEASDRRALSARLRTLVEQEGGELHALVGEAPEIERLRSEVRSVATTDLTVLVTGESGTGKEVVATLIHELGPRGGSPFVPVHCGALPEGLVDATLFGHVRGAFTGASRSSPGSFVEAAAGTIFLDEIGTMPESAQVRLLRVLQSGTLTPVGDTHEAVADARVVAATNENLAELVRAGRFRADLFYRLDVVRLEVPPLRERLSDVPLIARHLLHRFAKRDDAPHRVLTGGAIRRLLEHAWPGNVRELENVLQRALVSAGNRLEIRSDDIRLDTSAGLAVRRRVRIPREGLDLDAALLRVEQDVVTQALERCGGKATAAAQLLRLPASTLRRRRARLRD